MEDTKIRQELHPQEAYNTLGKKETGRNACIKDRL